jgi:hypothetical protein
VYTTRQDRAADYRRQAEEARSAATMVSLSDAKHQLLEIAHLLEELAEIEEHEARKSLRSKPSAGGAISHTTPYRT